MHRRQHYAGRNLHDAAVEAEYIALLCRHALCLQPTILVNEQIFNEWRQRVPATLSRDDARIVLTGLLDARLRIDDYQAIAKLAVREKPIGEVLEECLKSLSAGQVTLLIEAQYHDAICADTTKRAQILDDMRRSLFDELGVLCPYTTVQRDSKLRDRGFALVINATSGTPRTGIPPDLVQVNDTVDRLRLMNVTSTPWSSPDLRRPAALVTPDQEEVLTAAGLTVLSPLQYMAEAILEDLRRNASLFVHGGSLTVLRDKVSVAFPVLAKAASDAVPSWQVTAAIRELARYRVPIRALVTVLERVVDFPFNAYAPNRYSIGDDRIYSVGNGPEPTDLVSFLRTGLAREIAWAISRKTATVVAYLADEKELAPLHEPGETGFEETLDQFIRALEAEMRHLPPTAQIPCLLAAPKSASRLRTILRFCYPHLMVLSRADLPSDVNVQPIARIPSR